MRDIILSHKLEKERLISQTYIKRTGVGQARKTVGNSILKVITGPRRAGKSVFALQMLADKNFAYLNFDDERLLKQKNYDLFLSGIKEVYQDIKLLLFDEIQNLDQWELFVNRLQRQGYEVVLTGSNSKLLSQELASHLTGRYLEFNIYPFSFQEYLLAKQLDYKDADSIPEIRGRVLNALTEYLSSGGYPEIIVKSLNPKDYLTVLFEGILFKDIVKRYRVRYPKMLYELALYLISNFSCECTLSGLKKVLNFGSVHTIQNYISYFGEAFLIFNIRRFSFKLKQQLKAPEKTYTYDTGIVNALRFGMTPDYGRLMENLVATELLRRKEEIYYYKDKNGAEVDFVVKRGLKASELIQVSFDVINPKAKKREIKALLKAGRELSCKNLIVLTWDYEDREFYNGTEIVYLPLWKWLIGK
ncbi:MAG: ATP-binding protein [candidate division WOR-3 bacterium]